jgi:putative NIF3 family GTP cyclohydrolase 1 type 2
VRDAIVAGAHVLITGDVKYHEFMSAYDDILVADIGHYESEQYTKEIFSEIITKKIPNFAVQYAELEKNPINYL